MLASNSIILHVGSAFRTFRDFRNCDFKNFDFRLLKDLKKKTLMASF